MSRSLCIWTVAVGATLLLVDPAAAQQQPFGGGMGVGRLLADPDVAKELKLTEEQVTKVKEVGQEIMAKHREDFTKLRDLPREEMFKKFQEMGKAINDETMKALVEVLKPEQSKRLKQLELQSLGVRAFQDADVEKALSLTDDQKEKIKTISEDLGKDMREIRQGLRGGDREKMEEAMKKISAMTKEGMEKASAVLKDDQKKAWKELTGDHFEFKPLGGFRRPNAGT